MKYSCNFEKENKKIVTQCFHFTLYKIARFSKSSHSLADQMSQRTSAFSVRAESLFTQFFLVKGK